MGRQLYVNLPVSNVQKTKTFFSSLGFHFEPKFSNDDAICMIIADDIYVMLLAEPFFKRFIKKEISNAKHSTEVLLCLSCSSRQEVDALTDKALSAGGKLARDAQDLGFMYSQAFEDLDGHIWELMHMDPNAMPANA
ncbi:MAG TPA: VOC family protein [Permianibacter sp.]|nr:VOC family protein [Permianibacter sp.]